MISALVRRLMMEYQGDIESRGGSVALNSSAVCGDVSGKGDPADSSMQQWLVSECAPSARSCTERESNILRHNAADKWHGGEVVVFLQPTCS